MSRERLIKISKNRIYVTPDHSLALQQTNIPAGSTSFRGSEDYFWRVEVTEVNKDQKSVGMKVVEYYPTETAQFSKQTLKHDVEKLLFEPFDWSQLEAFLSCYKKSEFQGLIVEAEEKDEPDDVWDDDLENDWDDDDEPTVLPEETPREPHIEVIQEKCRVSFAKTTFHEGRVEFECELNRFPRGVTFEIHNPCILREFEYVKGYFPKVFGAHTFQVSVTVTVEDHFPSTKTARSPQIESIDQSTVRAVKDCRALALIKTPKLTKKRQALFTAADVFDNFEDAAVDSELLVLKQSEQDILSLLAKQKSIRNQKQLDYLAKVKQSTDHVIRFSLKPLFGFIFCITGPKTNHFCWELLDSNATYIWSIDNLEGSVADQFNRIDETICHIREIGSQRYKRAHASSELDSDLAFHALTHKSIQSDSAESFSKWKQELDRICMD
jgi:hypothetical protein